MSRKPKILVVDDEGIILRNCSRIFSRAGYDVDTAGSGKEALTRIGNSRYDVVLVDLVMPEMSGLELLGEINRRDPGTSVIVFSGFATVELAVEAMKAGALDFVPKPFTPDEILSRTEAVLRKKGEKRSVAAAGEAPSEWRAVIGSGTAMQRILALVCKVAPGRSPVLLSGEIGTGKKFLAQLIHRLSPRAHKEFVVLDCSTLAGEQPGRALFGAGRSSRPRREEEQPGILERAEGGTLLLKAIDAACLEIQAALWKVLHERVFQPAGNLEPRKLDVRFVFSTCRDLRALVEQNMFREDLFYRICVFPIVIPPLRERLDDIPILASYFLKRHAERTGGSPRTLSEEAASTLLHLDWPGNIRQLEEVIERMALSASREVLTGEDVLGAAAPGQTAETGPK